MYLLCNDWMEWIIIITGEWCFQDAPSESFKLGKQAQFC